MSDLEAAGFRIIGPVAYMGKKGCQDMTCRRWWGPNGEMGEDCIGYHCAYCDESCGSQGHKCPASEAVLGEARRILDEETPCP